MSEAKNQNSNHQKSQNNLPEAENYSPNLVQGKIAKLALSQPIYQNLFNTIFYIIVGLQLFFIVIVSINIYLNIIMSGLDNNLNSLHEQMVNRSGILQDSRSMSKKIALYKKVTDESVPISKMIESITKALPEGVSIETARFSTDTSNLPNNIDSLEATPDAEIIGEGTVEINSPDALTFALFINSLIEQGNVSSVSLNSADLDVASKKYRVKLGLTFTK